MLSYPTSSSITSSICLSLLVFFLINSKTVLYILIWKKYNLDKGDLGNYRLISHLSFLSKLTEKVVKLRLVDYLSTNNLLNSVQSAYIKHHSLLSVHDHIIKAMSHQHVTCLTLLDLTFVFDTIDHSILLERLSSIVLHFFYCSLLDHVLFTKPFFLWQYSKL